MSFKKKHTLSVLTLTMINVAAITGVSSLPMMGKTGMDLIFFYSVAALVFFLPSSLVSAELATAWPQKGGVYVWVKEALGTHWGFLAVWFQTVNTLAWFPTMIAFVAGSMAYIFNPELAGNKTYTASVVVSVFWIATLVNFRGMRVSGLISNVGSIAGTVLPGAVLIGCGIFWITSGNPSQVPLELVTAFPTLSEWSKIVFLAGTFQAFVGMEMSAVYAQEVKDPQRDYPKAILFSALIILAISILGSLAIAIVVPQHEISLDAGLMEAFTIIFNQYGIGYLIPLMALFVAGGAVAKVSTWIVGPSKGLLASSQSGDLPPFFQKMNKHGMPVNIMLVQGVIVTLFSLVFFLMPTVNTSYWILTALAAQLYLYMYALMFISAIILKIKKPKTKRPFKVPGGNLGMYIIAGLGFLGSLFCIGIGFVPPSDLLDTGSLWLYESVLIGGSLLLGLPPLFFISKKKASWKKMP